MPALCPQMESLHGHARGWPDPANPGVPVNPDKEGPLGSRMTAGDGDGAGGWDVAAGGWVDRDVPASRIANQWTYLGAADVPEQSQHLGQSHVQGLLRPR